MIGTRRALGYSGLRVGLGAAISLVSTMILSRLLTPTEVGVFSVAAGILALISGLRDLGVSSYVVREPELSAAKLGTCYAITLAAAWALAIVVVIAAPILAAFYLVPGMRDVLLVMALVLFVIPMNSMHLALLRRERRFDKLLYIHLASALAHAATSIGLALAGASYMALAWANFVALLVTIVVIRRVCAPLVRFVPSFAEWRSVAGFAGNSLGLTLVTTATNALPELIVGKALGLHDVGILSRAQGFSRPIRELVANAVQPVVFSVAAKKHREGTALAGDYLRAASFLSVLAWPVFGFMILMPGPLMRAMFGAAWDDSATILPWIAVNGLSLPIFAFNGLFLTTIGEIRTHLRVQVAAAPFKVGAWLLVIGYDLITAVQVFVIVHAVHVAVSTAIVCRRLGITSGAVARATFSGLPITCIALIVPAGFNLVGGSESMNALAALAITGVACAGMWLGAVVLLGHPVKAELLLMLGKFNRTGRRPGE